MSSKAIQLRSRWRRNSRLLRLGARVGLGHAGTSARKVFAGAERKEQLSRLRELKSAQQVADELGNMKGALMKVGQMASYLDDGLPEPMRIALSQLQSNAPPMAVELVRIEIERELGRSIKDRLREELDYKNEAANQQMFADFYRGHPFIHVPEVLHEYSTKNILITELVTGHAFAEVCEWSQEQRNMAGEAIFRFVFRSLYRFRAFNGDPHPGNYIFHGDGKVTFLDFGLIKHFTQDEMLMFQSMVKAAVIDDDMDVYRRVIEDAGMLQLDAPFTTEECGEYFSHFYEPVRESRIMEWSGAYATSIVRHTFDRTSAIAQYATVPKSFVFIQRINLGLYALLGQLRSSGNYRRISEELWPMTNASASTPMGEAEAKWLASRD